jgi:hypothetical protein
MLPLVAHWQVIKCDIELVAVPENALASARLSGRQYFPGGNHHIKGRRADANISRSFDAGKTARRQGEVFAVA